MALFGKLGKSIRNEAAFRTMGVTSRVSAFRKEAKRSMQLRNVRRAESA